MIRQGAAHKYGDNINTDLIIAGKYTKTMNFQDLAEHCLEDLDENFVKRVQAGDLLVAGKNFGCGSSREQAPLALKYAGVDAVLAESFARIFYRNATNVGLPAVVCDTTKIADGDTVTLDLDAGTVTINGEIVLPCQKLPPIMQKILLEGGLAVFLKKTGDFVSE